MKKNLTIATTAAVAIFLFFFSVRMAGAYAIGNGTPAPTAGSTSGGLNELFLPFENFFQSINSVGPSAVQVNPAPPQFSFFTNAAQNTIDQFDAWLYGVAGFHIKGLLFAILNIFSWILGLVQGAVNWLIGLFGK